MSDMIERVEVHMTKEVSRVLSEEIATLGLAGKTSRAEFAGALLGDALLGIREARAAVTQPAALMEPYTPERAAEIAGGQG
jgi:hypothetical protein